MQVIDPIYGRTVVVSADTPHDRDADGDYWFCGTGCRERYLADHAEQSARAAHTLIGS
jgi:xanthine dehydrogenase accessory factor